jgi:hypothetical protein
VTVENGSEQRQIHTWKRHHAFLLLVNSWAQGVSAFQLKQLSASYSVMVPERPSSGVLGSSLSDRKEAALLGVLWEASEPSTDPVSGVNETKANGPALVVGGTRTRRPHAGARRDRSEAGQPGRWNLSSLHPLCGAGPAALRPCTAPSGFEPVWSLWAAGPAGPQPQGTAGSGREAHGGPRGLGRRGSWRGRMGPGLGRGGGKPENFTIQYIFLMIMLSTWWVLKTFFNFFWYWRSNPGPRAR